MTSMNLFVLLSICYTIIAGHMIQRREDADTENVFEHTVNRQINDLLLHTPALT